MAPNINRLVMKHKKGFPYLSMTIEVNTITILNVFVVNQVMRGILDVTNEGLKFYLAQVAHFLKFMKVFM